MSRTRRALAGIVSSYTATAVMAAVSLILVPIVLRHVSREQYGLWATIAQAVGFLGLLDVGVGSAVTRRIALLSGFDDSAARIGRTLSTALAVYGALSVVSLAAGSSLVQFVPHVLSISPVDAPLAVTIFSLMVVYGALSLPLHVFVKTLYGVQRMVEANGVTLLENILAPVVTVLLLLSGVGIAALPIGAIAGVILSGLVGCALVWRAIPCATLSPRSVSAGEMRELFTWSWLLGLNGLAVFVIYQTDNVVVASGAGLAAATTYALTSRLPLYAMPLIFALADSCLPAVVELCGQGRIDSVRSVHLSVLRLSVGFAAGVGVVAIAFNEPFMRLWVGAQNFGGPALTAAFAIILVYRVAMQTAAMVVIGSGRIRGVVFMSLVEAALNFGLSLWWVRRLGIVGVALATVVAGLSTSAWYVAAVVSDVLRIRMWRYVLRGILVPLVCAVPALVVASSLRSALDVAGWVGLVAQAALTAAVYAATFVWLGSTGIERRQLWERAQRSQIINLRRFRIDSNSQQVA